MDKKQNGHVQSATKKPRTEIFENSVTLIAEICEGEASETVDNNNLAPAAISGFQVGSNTEMVAHLLKYLDKNDLLNCRLVNSLWNDEAVRLLTKTPKPYYFTLYIYDDSNSYKGFRCNLFKLAKSTLGPDRTLRNFHTLLEKSKHPQLLIKVLEIEHKLVEKFSAFPITILECEQILRKFGNLVKNLEINDGNDFNVLSRCLGKDGFCPNVEELKVTTSAQCNKENSFSSQLFLTNMGSLKLKKLWFYFNSKSIINPTLNESTSGILMALEGILQNSPGIEDLLIAEYAEYCTGPFNAKWCHPKTQLFIDVLKSKPHIMKNLKSFHFAGKILEYFPTLCDLQFGSHLRKMCLVEKSDFFSEQRAWTEEEVKEGLLKFLQKVSQLPTLQALELNLKNGWCTPISVNDFPFMAKLEELDMKVWSERLENFHFLKNFPSLKSLSLYMSGSETLANLLELEKSCWAEGDLHHLVHPILEYISISMNEDYIESLDGIRNLNVAFPNLTEFEFRPKPPSGSSLEEEQSWFEQAFHLISKMNNLNDLYINFEEWEVREMVVDLAQAFSYLRETPNLVKLIMLGFPSENDVRMVFSSLPALIGAPKLHKIKFDNCSNLNEDADFKARVEQLKIQFAESYIQLEVN